MGQSLEEHAREREGYETKLALIERREQAIHRALAALRRDFENRCEPLLAELARLGSGKRPPPVLSPNGQTWHCYVGPVSHVDLPENPDDISDLLIEVLLK